MCGINGFSVVNHLNNMVTRIRRMNDSLLHRGPDAGDYRLYANETIALGQRRLSIIDVQSRSNQPMVSASGTWVIVFNGEIYNYKELREKTSYPYQTASDTEVILAYAETFGIDQFLCDCNGMFAFCLYNIVENYFVVARDRMGIKPLYYTQDNKNFIFSSEIKGILASGLVEARFNESAIDEYLANRYVRAPYTFFENILQLTPGCKMRVDCGSSGPQIQIERYWQLPDEFNYESKFDERSILREFAYEFECAVKRRLVSDVPLGTYLSGGVDSSMITAITANRLSDPLHTYTVGFSELNEFDYAQLVSERYNTYHHKILVDNKNYFKHFEKVTFYKDAPLGVPNEIPLALMSKELKKDITVVLSGEGADELLGGYGRIYRSPFDFENHIKGKQSFYDYFIGLYEYVPRSIRDKYLNTDTNLRNVFDDKIRRSFAMHKNEENVFRYFHSYHVQGLLQRVDSTTMLASVEARVPFLDHKLIEFSYQSIPYDLKLNWKDQQSIKKASGLYSAQYSEKYDIPKYLLKRLAYQYLPAQIIERKKVGFPVPLDTWKGQIENFARYILKDAHWIKEGVLDSLITECGTNTHAGQILWMFANVEIFRSMYFEKCWRY